MLTEVFAAELADALAPALAEQLAPRLLKALELSMSAAASKKPMPATRSGSRGRKQDAR